MPFYASVAASTGLTLDCVVVLITDSGPLGNIWNESSGAFEAAPSEANQRIAMTEGTGHFQGRYFVSKSSLASQSGRILVHVIDRTAGTTVWVSESQLRNGETVSAAQADISPAIVSAARTFVLDPLERSPVAINAKSTDRFEIAEDTDATFAFDFSQLDWINQGTRITSVDSVSDSENPSSITIDSLAPSQTGMQAHFHISGVTNGNTHKLRCKVTATDGEVYAALAYLTVA